ncbi:MAG: hypothetical protein L0Y71_00330, partial [Gemmataceae bacterium]|nr:hypothetical protein [Gemmataceae bacterium]
ASSAFLHLAELGKKDRETAAAARPVLWAVVAARDNDVVSRGALRVLERIGPGSDAAALGDEPTVRQAVLGALAADSKLMTASGAHAWVVHGRLLLTLGRMGLPQDDAQRARVLKQVERGLRSTHSRVFAAAAQVVERNATLRPEETATIVPLLSRVLAFDFKFAIDPRESAWMVSFADGKELPHGQRAAVHALAALGPAAREALPALEAWAKRPLAPRRSDFVPEPIVNQIIRDALKAVEAVRGQ